MKRVRVKKGPYNTYLRKDDPIQHAPEASKRKMRQTESINEKDGQSGSVMQQTTTAFTTFVGFNGTNKEDAASRDSEEIGINVELHQSDSFNEQQMSPTGTDKFTEANGDVHGVFITSAENIPHSEMNNTITERIENTEMSIPSVDNFAQFQQQYEMAHDIPINMELDGFEIDEEVKDKNKVKELDTTLDDQHESKGAAFTPVHSGTSLTLGAGMLLIASFAQKASLTGESLQMLLDLIDCFCEPENSIPKTVRQFQKWFQDIKTPLIFHKYCSSCHTLCKGNNVNNCSTQECNADLSKIGAISHFIEIPIVDQIQALFRRPTFLNDIKYRFSRSKEHPDSIDDIYDGTVYKSLSGKGGILENPHNLSLLWNTDGIPCFKSSNMSLWPLFFQVNELSFPKRCDPNNMILGGLWFGSKKPTIMAYTEPLLKSLQDLEEVGINIENVHQENFNSKVVVIGGTADLPARSIICNSVQYNGKFGCSKCLQPGETFKTGPKGHVHIFPFQSENPEGPPRTHAGNIQHSFEAMQTRGPCHGIKGPTFLQCLKYHDLVSGICIDYMHGVLLGITKLLLCLWFKAEHKGELFSMFEFVDLVDNRLHNIKPPNTIKRTPRSIQEHLKHWKASELRSWLLYYSVPILRDIQDERYFQHYLLLVDAIFILLQNSIPVDQVTKADSLLKCFCCLFPALYGERYTTCNLHQLLHLPQMVVDMGPLWSYSCFPFENANGELLKLFHGTQNVDVQIAQSVCMMKRLPELENNHLMPGSREMDLLNVIKGVPNRNDKHLTDNIYAVGALSKQRLSAKNQAAVTQFLGCCPSEYLVFKRMRIGSNMFHSEMYQRCSVRNSYTIAYHDQSTTDVKFGQVQCYLQIQYCKQHQMPTEDCGCTPINAALVLKLKSLPTHIAHDDHELVKPDLGHIKIVDAQREQDICVVTLQSISYKCVYVDLADQLGKAYVCKMPNQWENE